MRLLDDLRKGAVLGELPKEVGEADRLDEHGVQVEQWVAVVKFYFLTSIRSCQIQKKDDFFGRS